MNKQVRAHMYLLIGLSSMVGLIILWQVIFSGSSKGSKGGDASQAVRGSELLYAKDRAAAALELGRRGDRQSVPYLMSFLKDRDPKVRKAVAEALGMMGDSRPIIDLLFRLDGEEEPEVRAAIVDALGELGSVDNIPRLVRCLEDSEPTVRLAAIEALGRWTTSNAVAGFAYATSDTNKAVRSAAGERLVNIGAPAIPAIMDVMRDGTDDAAVFRVATIDRIKSEQTIPSMVTVLRMYAGSYPPADTPVRKAVIEALVAKGEPAGVAVAPIVAEPGNLPLKSAVASILGRLKSPAGVNAVRDRLLSWKALSSGVEWKLWTSMLKAVDTPLAKDALARLDAHYATIAGKLPEVPRVPERRPIPPRKAIDPTGYTGELSLLLHKPPGGARKGIDLDMELSAEAGAWERVWGCNSFNRGVHEGLVLESKTAPDSFDLLLGVIVGDDPWVQGGFADLRLKLKRPASGKGPIEGTYEGTFKGLPVSGSVTGDERPRRPVVVKDYVPIHPEEHPRLLFRQHELAQVRRRATTPFGIAYQEACSKSADPLNHAMLYQITGDPNFAEASRSIIESYGDDFESSEGGFGSGGFGHRFVRTMLSYDLCYDAWPEDFKKRIRDHMRTTMPVLQKFIAITGANYDPCCNYYGPGRGAPAIAALALWGEKGAKPPPPPDPFSRPTVVPAADDYKPSPDTPVVDLTVGRSPDKWLIAGPAPFTLAPLAEESLLKSPTFRPQPGTTRKTLGIVPEGEGTKMAETIFMFAPLPKEMTKDGALDLASQCAPDGDNTFLLSTVLKVTGEQTVSIVLDGASSAWLNGTKLDPSDCALLRPGLYSMVVVCSVRPDRAKVSPRLVAPDSPEMGVRNAAHRFRKALWQADCDDWERYGGADPFWIRCASVGYWHMYAHYRVGIGDGGFQAETGGYADISSWFPLVYAGMSTRVLGRLPSPYQDITHMVPRRMMAVHFPADGGKPFAQKLNSCHGLSAGHCAAIFPALPEEYRAPLLWGWNRVSGMNGKESIASTIGGSQDLWGTSLGAALTFLNYPLDLEPVEPAKTMPLTWEAKTFGYYCFRSGWEGKDEFIAQVFLKAFNIGGWNDPNAGAFRLFGLGHEWVIGNEHKAGIRQFEPVVVLLPEWVAGTETDAEKVHADKREAAKGIKGPPTPPKKAPPKQPESVYAQNSLSHLMHYKAERDGSGVVSMDYRDVYSSARKNAGPSGITGMRSLAFDYSGRSGAPCLFTMVDKIEGKTDKVWLWPLPEGCISNTVVKGNTFVIRQGDATLKGTFVSPANVKIEATTETIVHQGARLFDKALDRIKATGDGSFFVVITVQRGDGPDVTAQGSDLDTHVTVGKQTVRFDGVKVVLGSAP